VSGARLLLLGAGGHARVVRALAAACGLEVAGVCDPALARDGAATWNGLPVLGDDSALEALPPTQTRLLNGLGQMPGSNIRARLHARLAAKGFTFPALAHPAAWVAPGVALGDGVQVMAGAMVQPGCDIGPGTIVNTRAGVDHDCRLGKDVHIAPGATLCGAVAVGDGAFVGAGATVLPGLRLGAGAMVAAGAVVTRDVPDGGRVGRQGREG
jgi:UDP-perosamine 4-acetyltransferase